MQYGAGRTAASEFRAGWRALTGAALGLATGALTIFYYTQGLFFGPLGAAFGWSRAKLSVIYLFGGFLIAAASVTVGWLVDMFGVRRPALVAYAVITAAFMAMSFSTAFFPLFMALQLLVIGLGAANGPANYTRVVNQRFDKARGTALGLAMGAVGAAALAAPPLVAWVIQAHGWRAGYQALALITAVSAPVVLILLGKDALPASRPTQRGPGPALSHMVLDPIFLRLLGAFALMALGVGGLVLHLVPVLTDAGYSLVDAGRIQGLIGLSVLFGRLLTGYLVDRIFAPKVAAVTAVTAALGLFALAALGPRAAAFAAVMVGLAMGAEGDVIGYLTARYFGLAAYGRLYGLLYGGYTIGLGAGSYLLAKGQELAGGYGPALYVNGVLMLAGAALLVGAPRFETLATATET